VIVFWLADDAFDVAANDITSKDNLDSLVQEMIARGRQSLAAIMGVSVKDEIKAIVEKVVKDLGGA
jgi:hypothetical protein